MSRPSVTNITSSDRVYVAYLTAPPVFVSPISAAEKFIQGTAQSHSPRLCGFCFHYPLGQLRTGFGPLTQ